MLFAARAKPYGGNASKLFKGVISNYDEIGPEVQRLIVDAFAVARKELGVDAD
jgi:hypothetical protein